MGATAIRPLQRTVILPESSRLVNLINLLIAEPVGRYRSQWFNCRRARPSAAARYFYD